MASTYRFVGDLGVPAPLSLLELQTLAKILAAGGPTNPRPFDIQAFEVTRGGPDTTYVTTIFTPVDGAVPPPDDAPFALAARLDTVFPDAPRSFTVPHVFGGSPVPEAPEILDRFELGLLYDDGTFEPLFEATGLRPFTATEVLEAVSDTQGWYEGVFSLLDNATDLQGTPLNDRLEVGAGNDTVRAGAGDDVVFKYNPGDLDYSGGPGHDALDFDADGPQTDDRPPLVEQLVVNLGTGTGRSPYGGDLTLTSVEEIRTTDQADRVVGSRRAETVEDGFGGANVFRLKGGDDAVLLPANFQGTLVDGGPGADRVQLVSTGFGGFDPDLGFGRQVLDIGKPGRCIEDFAGVRLKNVEIVDVSMQQDFMHLDLNGSRADEDLRVSNFFARANSEVTVRGRGGDDSLTGGFGVDTLLGGPGDDSLADLDGDDVLNGGGGRDSLNGGPGDDLLIGGGGVDTYVFGAPFQPDYGADTIRGFGAREVLDFTAMAETVARRRDLDIDQNGPDTVIADSLGNSVTLLGFDAADLSAENFRFAEA